MSDIACVATAPTPARAHGTIDPTAGMHVWTATPSSPVCGSRATMEYVMLAVSPRAGLLLQFERGDERLLRHLDPPDLLHALLSFFLALEQFPFASDVAAVTLRQHVFTLRFDRFPRDDPSTDRRLDRNVEELAGNELAQLRRNAPAVVVRLV